MGNRRNNKRKSRRKELPPEKAHEIRENARLYMENRRNQNVSALDPSTSNDEVVEVNQILLDVEYEGMDVEQVVN